MTERHLKDVAETKSGLIFLYSDGAVYRTWFGIDVGFMFSSESWFAKRWRKKYFNV